MGGMMDFVMLGGLALAGWWFLNNYKGSTPSPSAGGAVLPPVETPTEGAAPGTLVNPAGCTSKNQSMRDKLKLSPISECAKHAFKSTNSTCKCETSTYASGKKYVAVICESGGLRCAMSNCGTGGWSEATRKKLKIDKCKCEGLGGDISTTNPNCVTPGGKTNPDGTPSTLVNAVFVYAHGNRIPRMKMPRITNSELAYAGAD